MSVFTRNFFHVLVIVLGLFQIAAAFEISAPDQASRDAIREKFQRSKLEVSHSDKESITALQHQNHNYVDPVASSKIRSHARPIAL
jgi:hypothetical protein